MHKQDPAGFLLQLGTILMGAVLAGPAWGEKPVSGQTAASGPQASATAATRPAGKRMTLNPPWFRPPSLGSRTVSGSLPMRAEAWGWFSDEVENTYGFLDSILRWRVGQQKPGWAWQIEVAQPTVLGAPANWDLGLDSAINPHWATCLCLGTLGKRVMQSLYPKNPNAMFGYSELTLKF